MKRINHISISEWLIVICFIFLSITTLLQVLFRYVINFSLSWADELSRYCFVWLVFSGIVVSFVRGEHAVISLVIDRFQGKLKVVVLTLIDLSIFILFVVLAISGFKLMQLSLGQTTSGLGIPKIAVYTALPFGSALMLIELAIRFFKRLTGRLQDEHMEAIVMFVSFLIFIVFGVPIAFSIGLSVLCALSMTDISIVVFAQRVTNAADSFALLAIPLFILSGELMNRGGLTQRLVNFAHSLVGHIRGGLGQTSVLASMIFAGISGSAVADTTAIGSIMVPSMIKKNYNPSFVAALQASAGTVGPIIPPSILMILYGSMTEVSIGGLFLAGFIPGVSIGLGLMLVVYIFTNPKFQPGIVKEKWAGFRTIMKEAKDAIPALGMPIIIIVGITAGVFTPTEAGTIAVAYAFVVGMFYYKAFTFKDMPQIFLSAASVTAMVMSIIVFASAFGWLLAWRQIPDMAAGFMTSLTSNKYVFLAIIIVFLLILGTIMEVLAIATIFGPLLNIMGQGYGFDPVYFGIIMIIIMQMGGITPPVGILLNISCGLAHVKIEPTVKYLCLFVAVMLVVILLVIFYPPVAMLLPDLFLGHAAQRTKVFQLKTAAYTEAVCVRNGHNLFHARPYAEEFSRPRRRFEKQSSEPARWTHHRRGP